MAVTNSATGRYGNATVNSVSIPITEWTAKVHKEFAVSTDSGNYDATTQQLWRSRKPGEVWVEGTIKGNYDFGGTTDANFTQLFKSDGPYAVLLAFTRSTNFASFSADFDDVTYTVTVAAGAAMITFESPFVSNGVPTLY